LKLSSNIVIGVYLAYLHNSILLREVLGKGKKKGRQAAGRFGITGHTLFRYWLFVIITSYRCHVGGLGCPTIGFKHIDLGLGGKVA
jgi:hypothetical protein